jgi:hypothetical protein
MPNVRRVQAGYKVQPLSAFLHQPAPPAAPAVDFPKFTDDAFKMDFPKYLSFLLQFCPEVPEEKALRAKFAEIGIAPGKPFESGKLSDAQKGELALGLKEGYDVIEKAVANRGKDINGWRVGAAFGDRAFYHGDYLLRAAAARAGIYGNDAVEAMYPVIKNDGTGALLDGSKHNYTLTLAAGELPPVNAFWSVTNVRRQDAIADRKSDQPLPDQLADAAQPEENKDGSLSLYIQKDPPAADKKANWLPAPDGPIYMVMRLYWPKETPPSILPPGEGNWRPPALTALQ